MRDQHSTYSDDKVDLNDEKHQEGRTVVTAAPGHELEAQEADKVEVILRAEHEFTKEEYRKLQIKFDLILMPMLMIIYGVQFADKTSLSSGSVFGLIEDTGLKGQQYGTLTAFFYMSYAIGQLPMSWVLQRFPLGRSLALCCIVWGSLVMCLGACNNYSQLAAVRTLLGWFECVVTPGFAIFTASWWLREEQTLRQALYYSMNFFFSIIFGVGTYFIALHAQNSGGLAAWRVINLFLGGVTVGMGFIFLIFGGTPDEVWWLSKREKIMAKARIVSNATGGGESHPWKWEQVTECFRDWQWWNAVVYGLLGNIPNGALTTFSYLIFRTFGFTNLETILYSLPTYGITIVVLWACAICARYVPNTIFPLSIITMLLTLIALFIVGLADISDWAKWGVFNLSYMSVISTFIMAWPCISVNVAGRTKKSFFGATSLFVYCIGNIIGSQIFANDETFTRGLILCAACTAANCINMGTWWWAYAHLNKKREREFLASGMTMEERERQNRIHGELDMTDLQNPHFRYFY